MDCQRARHPAGRPNALRQCGCGWEAEAAALSPPEWSSTSRHRRITYVWSPLRSDGKDAFVVARITCRFRAEMRVG